MLRQIMRSLYFRRSNLASGQVGDILLALCPVTRPAMDKDKFSETELTRTQETPRIIHH